MESGLDVISAADPTDRPRWPIEIGVTLHRCRHATRKNDGAGRNNGGAKSS